MPELCVQASNISLIESAVTYTCTTSANLITLTLSILLKDDIKRCNAINQLKKAQISKLENNTKQFRIDTILKVLNALGAKLKLSVELGEIERLVIE